MNDELGKKLREVASSRGMSLSAFLAEAGRAAISADRSAQDTQPFQLITRDGSGAREGVELDQPGALIAAEEERDYRL